MVKMKVEIRMEISEQGRIKDNRSSRKAKTTTKHFKREIYTYLKVYILYPLFVNERNLVSKLLEWIYLIETREELTEMIQIFRKPSVSEGVGNSLFELQNPLYWTLPSTKEPIKKPFSDFS